MNEQQLLDSLHDGEILAILADGHRVIVEINHVDHWEPHGEGGYLLVHVPARLIFEDAEIVTQTGEYARLDELPDFHPARTILWVDVVDGVYHFATTGDGSLAIRARAVRLERLEQPALSPVLSPAACPEPRRREGLSKGQAQREGGEL